MPKEKISPTIKDIVGVLADVTSVGVEIMFPTKLTVLESVKGLLTEQLNRREEIKNSKFDKVRLWSLIRRLEKQKDIHFVSCSDGSVQLVLTQKGKVKHLKFKLDELGKSFKPKDWDGKWRLIFFDVPEKKRNGRDTFRRILKNLKFYQLQKSVYLTPYSCQDEIEYLRRFLGLDSQVQVLVTESIENDQAYRLYFGLG